MFSIYVFETCVDLPILLQLFLHSHKVSQGGVANALHTKDLQHFPIKTVEFQRVLLGLLLRRP